jgi:hypothetical protein
MDLAVVENVAVVIRREGTADRSLTGAGAEAK